MKSIYDYHKSDRALLSDIQTSLYEAPLSRANSYLASTSLSDTITSHLINLKSEYGIPFHFIDDAECKKPLGIYKAIVDATELYKVSESRNSTDFPTPYPFLVLFNPPLNEKGFDYQSLIDALNKGDPFIEPGRRNKEWNSIIEQYNLYNATALPISFVAKCNIIIITDIDLIWKPEPFVYSDLSPTVDVNRMLEEQKEHELRTNSKNIPYIKNNQLYSTTNKQWIRPEYKESKVSGDIKKSYSSIFDSDEGKAVLSDLERIANQTKIDANEPNPNAAIYKLSQLALIQRIKNQISRE